MHTGWQIDRSFPRPITSYLLLELLRFEEFSIENNFTSFILRFPGCNFARNYLPVFRSAVLSKQPFLELELILCLLVISLASRKRTRNWGYLRCVEVISPRHFIHDSPEGHILLQIRISKNGFEPIPVQSRYLLHCEGFSITKYRKQRQICRCRVSQASLEPKSYRNVFQRSREYW